MHEPEKWGYIYFSEKSVGEPDNFTYGKDEAIKQKLYEIHRNVKRQARKHSGWKNIEMPKMILIDNQEIELISETHSRGYNISLKSPFTKKTLIISEDGKLIRY